MIHKIIWWIVLPLLILLYIIAVYSHGNSVNKHQSYIEIQRIDNNRYIQCINNVKYIVSSTSATALLDKTGKPESCKTEIYTYNQRYLEQNKNKKFIFKEIDK